MEALYHRQMLTQALGGRVSARALAAITRGNLGQDSVRGLLRPEFHFDDNLFALSLRYLESCRTAAAEAVDPAAAWAAFGRLSHGAQDFYAHSNYTALWARRYAAGVLPAPAAIDGLDAALLTHPDLRSGRVYWPTEALWAIHGLRPLVKRLVPRDSHAWMNLDAPAAGPLFPYAIAAAVQRTVAEFERTLALIGETQGAAAMRAFLDL